MDIYTRIKRAPHNISTAGSSVLTTIEFNGKSYTGVALCHPEDRDFLSEKVGINIALSRARLRALIDYKEKLREELALYKKFVYECGHTPEAEAAYERAKARLEKIYTAIKREKTGCRNYIKAQDKAISIIKRYRANKDKDN